MRVVFRTTGGAPGIFDANAPLWLILGTVEQWNAENQQSRLRISNQVAKTGKRVSHIGPKTSVKDRINEGYRRRAERKRNTTKARPSHDPLPFPLPSAGNDFAGA